VGQTLLRRRFPEPREQVEWDELVVGLLSVLFGKAVWCTIGAQRSANGVNERTLSHSKQMKRGVYEQGRKNFQTAADPDGSHGLHFSATCSYLREIAVTAAQRTIYI
jgi:hypothetical protein